jgi:MoaA/NifB/PqqE/SkfB family radical SAM enzyme
MSKFEITTMIGCPLMCNFCPQDKIAKAYKDPIRVLTLENFKLALSKIPNEYKIVFSGFTEAWTNKHCTDFVEHAVKSGRNVGIYTTLFGMTQDDVDRLVDLFKSYPTQLNEFVIHLPDNQGNMIGWRTSKEYEYALNTLKAVSYMTMDQHGQVHPEVKSTVKPVQWYLHTRAGNLDTKKLENQFYHEPARYDFVVECTRDKNLTSSVMLPNGDLALCCMDYGLKHIIGNIFKQDYKDIINGYELNRIKRLNNTLEYTDEVLCKSCNDGNCRTPWNDDEVYQRTLKEAPHWLGL